MNCHALLCALPALTVPGDLGASIERLAQQLIRRAARWAPAGLAERLEEEWLADCLARPHALAQLRLALGCCWAIRIIAHEHAAVAAPATSTVRSRTVTTLVQHDATFFSRRSAALLLIIALHVVLVYLLANGLIHARPADPPTVLNADFLPAPVRHPPPLPPSNPTFTHTRIPDIDPDVHIDQPPASDSIRVPTEADTQPAPKTPAFIRVAGGPGAGFPNTADFYPPASIRMHEEGSAAIRVCVDTRGRLTAAPALAQSSGSPRLDAAAARLALAGSGHYRPSMEDGRAVNSCYAFGVRFRMQD